MASSELGNGQGERYSAGYSEREENDFEMERRLVDSLNEIQESSPDPSTRRLKLDEFVRSNPGLLDSDDKVPARSSMGDSLASFAQLADLDALDIEELRQLDMALDFENAQAEATSPERRRAIIDEIGSRHPEAVNGIDGERPPAPMIPLSPIPTGELADEALKLDVEIAIALSTLRAGSPDPVIRRALLDEFMNLNPGIFEASDALETVEHTPTSEPKNK